MPSFSSGSVVLVRYPFTDLSNFKVRPAVVVSSPGSQYDDLFVVPLTSRTEHLSDGEFLLSDWQGAGLNVPTAVKRGIVLLDAAGILKPVGSFAGPDLDRLRASLRRWLDLH